MPIYKTTENGTLHCLSYSEIHTKPTKNAFYSSYSRTSSIGQKLENTKIYKFYLEHPEITGLQTLIENISKEISFPYIICSIYRYLIQNNLLDIVFELLDDSPSYDNSAICYVAIEQNQYDVLQELFGRGFSINNIILESYSDQFHNPQLDVLGCAVFCENQQMCQFLVEQGSHPSFNHGSALLESCMLNESTIMEYFLTSTTTGKPIPQIWLIRCLNTIITSSHCNADKINILISAGLDVATLSPSMAANTVQRCPVDIIKLLQQYGLVLCDEFINTKLCIDPSVMTYLLEEGCRPTQDMLQHAFESTQIEVIKLFMRFNVDFSLVTTDSLYDDLINDLDNHGMDVRKLIWFYLHKQLKPKIPLFGPGEMGDWYDSSIEPDFYRYDIIN